MLDAFIIKDMDGLKISVMVGDNVLPPLANDLTRGFIGIWKIKDLFYRHMV